MQVGGSDVVVDGASCDGRTELVKAIQGQNAGVSAVLLCRSLLLKKCRMCHSYRLCVALRRTTRTPASRSPGTAQAATSSAV